MRKDGEVINPDRCMMALPQHLGNFIGGLGYRLGTGGLYQQHVNRINRRTMDQTGLRSAKRNKNTAILAAK